MKHWITFYDKFKEYSKEEIKEIHKNGELTLFEKAREYYDYDLCPDGEQGKSSCPGDVDCFNCIKYSLMDTGKRSFPKMTLYLKRTDSFISGPNTDNHI